MCKMYCMYSKKCIDMADVGMSHHWLIFAASNENKSVISSQYEQRALNEHWACISKNKVGQGRDSWLFQIFWY